MRVKIIIRRCYLPSLLATIPLFGHSNLANAMAATPPPDTLENRLSEAGMMITFLISQLIKFCVIIGIYCLPSIVAIKRNRKDKVLICILNLALGWTVIGWIFALIFALGKEQRTNNVNC